MAENKIPEWVVAGLIKIQEMEIALGNIPNSKAWQTRDLDSLINVFNDRDMDLDPDAVDLQFERLIRKIAELGLQTVEIVKLINTHIGYDGGPPYCNEEEILEIISEKS